MVYIVFGDSYSVSGLNTGTNTNSFDCVVSCNYTHCRVVGTCSVCDPVIVISFVYYLVLISLLGPPYALNPRGCFGTPYHFGFGAQDPLKLGDGGAKVLTIFGSLRCPPPGDE